MNRIVILVEKGESWNILISIFQNGLAKIFIKNFILKLTNITRCDPYDSWYFHSNLDTKFFRIEIRRFCRRTFVVRLWILVLCFAFTVLKFWELLLLFSIKKVYNFSKNVYNLWPKYLLSLPSLLTHKLYIINFELVYPHKMNITIPIMNNVVFEETWYWSITRIIRNAYNEIQIKFTFYKQIFVVPKRKAQIVKKTQLAVRFQKNVFAK